MFHRFIPILGPALVFTLLGPAANADPTVPAARCVPSSAIAGVEILQPKILLHFVTSPKVVELISSLPAYKRAVADPKFDEMQGGVRYLESRLGVKWPEAMDKLFGGGLLVTVHPHEGMLAIIDVDDAQFLRRLHEVLVEIARGEAAKAGQPDRVQAKQYAGETVWTFGKDEAHAILGSRLIWTNRALLLKQSLDVRAKTAKSLASQEAYQGARKAAGDKAVGVAFADLRVLKQIPGIRKALSRSENPMAALLFAAVTDALNEADWLGVGLSVSDNTLRFKVAMDGKASTGSKAAFALPQGNCGALPNLAVPGFIAGASLYRDLHGFYASKDQLFPERTSGLIFFENMMGIFFSGRDLTDEVLAETRPEVRIVVAEQKYDPTIGTPRVRVPGFAAIFRLQHPEKAGEMAEEAWQKALGLVNFTRGQKAQPGLILDRDEHAGVRYSVACFSASDVKDKADLDVRFNFRPALARVGDYLVVSSTDSLAVDLIDALKKEASESIAAVGHAHSLIEVDGARLASILEVNRKALVRQSMVEKGKTEQQAQADLDMIVGWIRHVVCAKFDAGAVDGQQEASLDLKLDLP